MAAARAIAAARAAGRRCVSLQEIHRASGPRWRRGRRRLARATAPARPAHTGAARAPPRSRSSHGATRRLHRPLGRRPAGPAPEPGQFAMLASSRGGAAGPTSGRSCRGRSRSPGSTRTGRSIPARGRRPGHAAGSPSCAPATALWLLGPLGRGFAPAARRRGGRSSSAAASGSRRSRSGRTGSGRGARAARVPRRRARRGRGAARRRADRDRRRVARPPRPRDRAVARGARERRARRGLRLRAAADAGGGARALRRARRPGPARVGVRDGMRLRRMLRLRRADARGLCPALRRRPGAGSGRTWRWSRPVHQLCGIELAHPIINASARSTRSPRGARSATPVRAFPFAAFVSKTVTLEPRAGNPPPRLWELGAGMINSIGLPNKGLAGYLAEDLPVLRRAAGAADRQRHGLDRRGGRRARRGGRRARRGRRAGAQRLVPERQDRADHRRRPGARRRRWSTRVRPLTAKPLIVKLTPNAPSPAAVAAAAEEPAPTPSR